MKIGIDLHGTINSYPEHFENILEKMMNDNMTVVIISGPPTKEIERELKELSIYQGKHYHLILSVVDFLKRQNVKMWQDENGNWWCSEEDWWKSKARICLMYDIDYLIDDQLKYAEHFKEHHKTKFTLWNSKDQSFETLNLK